MQRTESKTTDKLELLTQVAAEAIKAGFDLSKLYTLEIKWVDEDGDGTIVPNIFIQMK